MAHSLVCQLPSDQERRSKEAMIFNSLNLSLYSSSLSKTDQIMSRYRPIAPKPQLSMHHHHPILDTTSSSPPQKPQRPRPFLRNLSPHLQSTRPSRGCRKRTKPGSSPCNSKRPTTTLLEFSSSISPHAPSSSLSSPSSPLPGNALLNRSMRQGFAPVLPRVTVSTAGFDGGLEKPITTASANLVTLPLLPHPPTTAPASVLTRSLPAVNYYSQTQLDDEEALDLNSPASEFPREDHHLLLQKPLLCCKVIAPQPLRPIVSSISVGWISENPSSTSTSCAMPMRGGPKRPEEVEEEVEWEVLPAVVSDSNNRVRLANSAYKEMVGQPECSWLDATYDAARVSSGGGGACKKRISGEVTLHLSDAGVPPAAASSNGFCCKVRIEWGSNGKKNSIYAPCDVTRLSCVPMDYLFTWRFHTREASEEEANSHA